MNKKRGSAVIYVVLLVFVLMTSAAIVLSTVLSKHIRASENYLLSEQAFAAANSGIEQMFYQFSKGRATGKITVGENIEYETAGAPTVEVKYKGTGCVTETGTHLTASGTYRSLVRRIDFGGGSGGC